MDPPHLGVALCGNFLSMSCFGTGCRPYNWGRRSTTNLFGSVRQPAILYFICIYRAFFFGQCAVLGTKELSKTAAAPRCKFFLWLTLLDRCWTSEWLQRHNLQNNGALRALFAGTGDRRPSSLLGCSYSRGLISRATGAGFQYLMPSVEMVLADWWITTREREIHKLQRKGFDTIFLLLYWMLWNIRNNRVFEGGLHPRRPSSRMRGSNG
jgi:hypothetical protein